MQFLLDGLIKKEIKKADVVIGIKTKSNCDKREKEFPTEVGLRIHKSKMHGEKKDAKLVI